MEDGVTSLAFGHYSITARVRDDPAPVGREVVINSNDFVEEEDPEAETLDGMDPVEAAALDLLSNLESHQPTPKRARIENSTSTVVYGPEPRPAQIPSQPIERAAKPRNISSAYELSIEEARRILGEARKPDGQFASIQGVAVPMHVLASTFFQARDDLEKGDSENVVIQKVIDHCKNFSR